MELLVFAIEFEIILTFGKLCLSLRHDKISSLNMMNYIFFRVDIHPLISLHSHFWSCSK